MHKTPNIEDILCANEQNVSKFPHLGYTLFRPGATGPVGLLVPSNTVSIRVPN